MGHTQTLIAAQPRPQSPTMQRDWQQAPLQRQTGFSQIATVKKIPCLSAHKGVYGHGSCDLRSALFHDQKHRNRRAADQNRDKNNAPEKYTAEDGRIRVTRRPAHQTRLGWLKRQRQRHSGDHIDPQNLHRRQRQH